MVQKELYTKYLCVDLFVVIAEAAVTRRGGTEGDQTEQLNTVFCIIAGGNSEVFFPADSHFLSVNSSVHPVLSAVPDNKHQSVCDVNKAG